MTDGLKSHGMQRLMLILEALLASYQVEGVRIWGNDGALRDLNFKTFYKGFVLCSQRGDVHTMLQNSRYIFPSNFVTRYTPL